MKKTIIYLMLMLVVLASVIGANPPKLVSNTTTNIGTETFTINVRVNETSLIKYSVSQGGSEIERATISPNSTTFSRRIENLEGNTVYTWQVNFSSLGENLKVVDNYTITDNYVLLGAVRTILSLFALLLCSLIMIFSIREYGTSTAKIIQILFLGVIGLMVLINLINAVLLA